MSVTQHSAPTYLGILVHSFFHVLQKMVVWATFFLINVNYSIKIGEISVQIYPLGIASTNKPVFKLTRLNEEREHKEKGDE